MCVRGWVRSGDLTLTSVRESEAKRELELTEHIRMLLKKGRNRVRKKNENEVIQPSPILWHQRNFLSRVSTGPEEGKRKLKFVPCSVCKVFPHLRGSGCL